MSMTSFRIFIDKDQREASAAGNPPPEGAAMEFRPIEHPSEPPQHNKPITCPQPEPPILYVRAFDLNNFVFLLLNEISLTQDGRRLWKKLK